MMSIRFDVLAPRRYVSFLDDAIDWKGDPHSHGEVLGTGPVEGCTGPVCSWARWLDGSDDAALHVHDGQQPTVFTLEPLSFQAMVVLRRMDLNDVRARILAGRLVLIGVEPPLMVGGKPWSIEREQGLGGLRVSDAALAQLGAQAVMLFEELGAFALRCAIPSSLQKKALLPSFGP